MAGLDFKRLLPSGLYGRAALILILPIFAIQLIVSIVFLQRHFEGVTRQMTETVALEIAMVLARVEAAPDPATALIAGRELAEPLKLTLDLPFAGTPVSYRAFYDFSGREVDRILTLRLPQYRQLDLSNFRRVTIWLETRHGLLLVEFNRQRVSASNPHQLLVLMVFAGLLLTAISFVFLRNQLRPIRRLARAAEAFGKGRHMNYRVTGASEVRAAGQAFLDMRERIEGQIEQRTMMLSGVSHDLRTPITRLKLSLSLVPEDGEVRAMLRDVTDMERLVDEFLDFARGESEPAAAEDCDPVALVREVVERAARAGQQVTFGSVSGTGRANLRIHSVKRAVENLIGNAVRYGTLAEVGIEIRPNAVLIAVEDDGPGIPPERREEAMQPFARLDAARNQDRGSGVGLGLAIAADAARSHGGSLSLGQGLRLGGLRAVLELAR